MSGFQSRDAQQNLGGAFGPISPGRCQREIERRLGITSTSTAAPAVAHVPAAAQAMPVPRRSLSSRIVGAVWPAGGVVAGTPVVQSSSSPTAVVAGTPVVVSGTPVAPVVAPARGDGTTFRAHLHQIYAAPGATPAVAVVEGAPVQPARSLSGRLYDRLPSSSDLYNALPSRPRVLSGSGGQTATREPILPAATPRSDAATLRSPDAPRPARQPSRPVQLARQASRTLYATVAPPPPSEECTAGTVFRTIKYLWILSSLSWLSFYYTPTSIATNTYVIKVGEASPRWPQAQCTLLGPTSLLSSPLGGRGATRLSYRIDARVRFETVHPDPLTNQIDATVVTSTAHEYPTDRYWVTDAVARSDAHAEQLAVKAALDEAYGNGARVPCWYDPSEPADVMLTQDPSVLHLSGPNSLEAARTGKVFGVVFIGPLIALTLPLCWIPISLATGVKCCGTCCDDP